MDSEGLISFLRRKGIPPATYALAHRLKATGIGCLKICRQLIDEKAELPIGWSKWTRHTVWALLNPDQLPDKNDRDIYSVYLVIRMLREKKKSYNEIASLLNEQKINTRSGKGEWNDSSVRAVATNNLNKDRFKRELDLSMVDFAEKAKELHGSGHSITEISRILSSTCGGIKFSYSSVSRLLSKGAKSYPGISFSIKKLMDAVIKELHEKSISQLSQEIGVSDSEIVRIITNKKHSPAMKSKRAFLNYFGTSIGRIRFAGEHGQ